MLVYSNAIKLTKKRLCSDLNGDDEEEHNKKICCGVAGCFEYLEVENSFVIKGRFANHTKIIIML